MLTNQEMLVIAEKFIRRKVDESVEPIILHEETIKKPYGNIYYYQSKEFLMTRDFNKHLAGNAPFLVEKKAGRVVGLGTAMDLEDYIKAYENGTLVKTLTRYWYPDEDRFDYK